MSFRVIRPAKLNAFYRRGLDIWDRGGPALFGVCFLNGFYTRKNIVQFVKDVSKQASKTFVFIPDRPALYTYQAAGYPNSEKKWSRQNRYFKNILNDDCRKFPGVEILSWDQIALESLYQKELNKLEDDPIFKEMYSHLTAEVIFKNRAKFQDPPVPVSDQDLDLGFNYLLEEVAFFRSIAEILGYSEMVECCNQFNPLISDEASLRIGGVILKKQSINESPDH